MKLAVRSAHSQLVEVQVIVRSSPNRNVQIFFEPDYYFKDFAFRVMLQFGVRRINLLVIKKTVLMSLMNHFVADSVLA